MLSLSGLGKVAVCPALELGDNRIPSRNADHQILDSIHIIIFRSVHVCQQGDRWSSTVSWQCKFLHRPPLPPSIPRIYFLYAMFAWEKNNAWAFNLVWNVKVKKNEVTSWSLITYLFKEDEGEDSMGAQPEVVGGEPFPQGEESLVFDHLRIRIQSSSVTSEFNYTLARTSPAPLYSGTPSTYFIDCSLVFMIST